MVNDMDEFTDKCFSCKKANSIPRWGWLWPCFDKECHYEPLEEVQTVFNAMSKSKENK